LLLVLLGAWGALIPVVGPIFGYGYTPDAAWTMTEGRWILQVAPGAAVFIAGLMLLGAGSRAVGLLAGWLAAVGGAWFVLGSLLSVLWTPALSGMPLSTGGATVSIVAEQIGVFAGLGVVILFLGGLAVGRFSLQGVRDQEVAAHTRTRADGALDRSVHAESLTGFPSAAVPAQDIAGGAVAAHTVGECGARSRESTASPNSSGVTYRDGLHAASTKSTGSCIALSTATGSWRSCPAASTTRIDSSGWFPTSSRIGWMQRACRVGRSPTTSAPSESP
jgi:hypothetical protein